MTNPPLFESEPKAVLVFADGTFFVGKRLGSSADVTAEVVFNTSMTGYQEVLTDPSYKGQMVTFTNPHIGNVGINDEDGESNRVFVAAIIMREESVIDSNFRSKETLDAYLKRNSVVGIKGIDTRRLTRYLRANGAQNGCLMAHDGVEPDPQTLAKGQEKARQAPLMAGQDLAQTVSSNQSYQWNTTGLWNSATMAYSEACVSRNVVVLDFGVKHNILRHLTERGCALTVLPAKSDIASVLAHNPQGVMFSNGPGDPGACDYAITLAKELLQRKIPLFGICLGHQIMALAAGAKTLKMKFGHHGSNHPVQDVATKKVYITTQNHGFAVDGASLPASCVQSHISLFDGSCQGIRWNDAPALSFQGHPEASAGPHDIEVLFDEFISLMVADE